MNTEKGDYYESSRKYLNSVMLAMNQDDLIEALHELNIDEMKCAIACGVPGEAQRTAVKLLGEQKAEIRAYISKKGAEANAQTNIDLIDDNIEDETDLGVE